VLPHESCHLTKSRLSIVTRIPRPGCRQGQPPGPLPHPPTILLQCQTLLGSGQDPWYKQASRDQHQLASIKAAGLQPPQQCCVPLPAPALVAAPLTAVGQSQNGSRAPAADPWPVMNAVHTNSRGQAGGAHHLLSNTTRCTALCRVHTLQVLAYELSLSVSGLMALAHGSLRPLVQVVPLTANFSDPPPAPSPLRAWGRASAPPHASPSP
jgi:hypothetical protein